MNAQRMLNPSLSVLPLLLLSLLFSGCKKAAEVSPSTSVTESGKVSKPTVAAKPDLLREFEARKAVARPSGQSYRSLRPLGESFQLGGGEPLLPTTASTPPPDQLAQIRTGTLNQASVVELLELAAETGEGRLIGLVDAVLQQTNPDLRSEALRLFSRFSGKEVADLLLRGLNDPQEEVRLAALEGAIGLSTAYLTPVLQAAFNNASVDVRMNALEMIESLPPALQLGLLVEGAQNSASDVAVRSLDSAIHLVNKRRIMDFFPALDSPQAEVQATAQEFFEFHLGQTFDSQAKARAWWQANSHRFDQDLIEVQLDP
jgi:hypothetical protein